MSEGKWGYADFEVLLSRGLILTTDGCFHKAATAPNVHVQPKPHEWIAKDLAERAGAGDEFAARALAEAFRRRMMR